MMELGWLSSQFLFWLMGSFRPFDLNLLDISFFRRKLNPLFVMLWEDEFLTGSLGTLGRNNLSQSIEHPPGTVRRQVSPTHTKSKYVYSTAANNENCVSVRAEGVSEAQRQPKKDTLRNNPPPPRQYRFFRL